MNVWVSLALQLLPIILAQHPKTAKIANEVTQGVVEAEQVFGPNSGPDKLAHVVNIAKNAAQAADELRGSADDVAGPVGGIVSAAIPLINELAKHAQ